MTKIVKQATSYAGASALAFGADITLLSLMVSGLGAPYLHAAAFSFLAGTVVVYWFSIRKVFDYRRLADWRAEFAIFAGLGVGGLGVNLVVIFSVVEGLGIHYLIAKVAAAGCTFVVNFLLRRWMLFLPLDRDQVGDTHRAGAEP